MRIVIAAGIYPPDIGGPATYAQKLVMFLKKRAHDVVVITYGDRDLSQQDLVVIQRSQNKVVAYLKYFFKLWRSSKDADVLYAQGPLVGGLQCAIVSYLKRIPFVVKITGDYAWEQAVNQYRVDISINEFQNYKGSLPLKIRMMRSLQHLVVRTAQAVIAPSQYLSRIVKQWNGQKIKIIYNSVDIRSHNKSKLRRIHKQVVTVGRLVTWKGFKTLIDQWHEVRVRVPEATLSIIGDGPEFQHLQESIHKNNARNFITLCGRMNHEELMKYMNLSAVFILNSGYEGLSHVVLEAQSMGLPCALSNVGGNAELVEHEKTGLLFTYNNSSEIVDTIATLLIEVDKAALYVTNAFKRLSQFSNDTMLSETENFLQSLTKENDR